MSKRNIYKLVVELKDHEAYIIPDLSYSQAKNEVDCIKRNIHNMTNPVNFIDIGSYYHREQYLIQVVNIFSIKVSKMEEYQ